MKICVVGLGLIGGSMCMALKRAGYKVYGYNRSPQPLKYALENGIITEACNSFNGFDVVFVALPPKAAISFILNTQFKNGAVVADICGVKQPIENAVYSAKLNINYVGTHPMAGKEVSGIQNACADLFDNANMVITHGALTNAQAVQIVKSLTAQMGFKRVVECSAQTHDNKIAYTSQLAHVVSNCYVRNGEIESCLGFTGGSFQDMTRIAGVDEDVWSELYLMNRQALSNTVQQLISALSEFKTELDGGDQEKLKQFLTQGKTAFQDGKSNSFSGGGITVTNLK